MSTPKGCIKRGELLFADPANIVRRKGWNTRFDFGDLSDITIGAHGFYKHKPLLVRRNDAGQFEIIDGDRRFMVIEKMIKAGHVFEDGIPIILAEKDIDDVKGTVYMLTANNGKAFLPLEEAAAYKRLIDGGMKPKEIAKEVGRSEGHVKWTLELLNADPSVQEAVQKGEIAATTAKTIATKAKGDTAKQKELVSLAKSGKAGAVAAKKAAQQIVKSPKRKKVHTAKPLSVAELEAQLDKLRKQYNKALKATSAIPENLRSWIQSNDLYMLAFAYGALQSMEAAGGKADAIPVL